MSIYNRDYGPKFEAFWKAYPRKVNKGAAFKAFEKLKLSSDEVDELVWHIERRKRDDAKWIEGKFIPHAASFLNGHRWLDDYEKVRQHWTQRQPQQSEPEPEPRYASPETVQRELEKLKRTLH